MKSCAILTTTLYPNTSKKFKGFRISEVPIYLKFHRKNSKVVKSIFRYTLRQFQ